MTHQSDALAWLALFVFLAGGSWLAAVLTLGAIRVHRAFGNARRNARGRAAMRTDYERAAR